MWPMHVHSIYIVFIMLYSFCFAFEQAYRIGGMYVKALSSHFSQIYLKPIWQTILWLLPSNLVQVKQPK